MTLRSYSVLLVTLLAGAAWADPQTGTEAAAAAPAAPAAPADPFAFADFGWVPGNAGPVERPLTWGPLTGEVRADIAFATDFANPKDHTISGSSEVFRNNEIQVTQFGFGGDFNYKGVQARLMTQLGLYATATPRGDGSTGRGQFDLATAYRYLSEAWAGYHIDALNGINVQAGLFTSYLGMWSYYNFDNWAYEPSFIASCVPWYLMGARVQIYVSDKLKIEPWITNGWQGLGAYANGLGGGGQVLWRPTGWVSATFNLYAGADTLGDSKQVRLHMDDWVAFKYYENKDAGLSKGSFSVELGLGCETGPNISCSEQNFVGFMAYNRLWFLGDKLGVTLGGGFVTNPGRYLILAPPINGSTGATGSYYFATGKGTQFSGWDVQAQVDYSPKEFLIVRLQYNHRGASEPYFAGRQGLTPPGGNTGTPTKEVEGWSPDLTKTDDRLIVSLGVKF
jgi:hypothetical protein